jgi:CRP-like cAMP-binding protein
MRLFSQNTKVEALKRAPLFSTLSRKELTELAKHSEDLEVSKGTVLCKEGDIGHEFFVIVEGKTEITRKGKKLAIRGGGEFVGEIALLEKTRRMATVTAETDLRLFVLTEADFRQLVKSNPGVQGKVMTALAHRLVELSGDPTLS